MTYPASPSTPLPTMERTSKSTEATLSNELSENSALDLAIVSTVDGRVISIAARNPRSGDRLGAVFSTLLSIAETACRELAIGRVKQVLLTADGHNIFVVRIGASSSPFVLATAYTSSLLLGSALHMTQSLSQTIANQLATQFADVLPNVTAD